MQTETQQAQQALHDKLMRAVTMTSDYTLFMSTLALIVATWLLQVPHDLNRNEVTQLLFAALVPPLPDPGRGVGPRNWKSTVGTMVAISSRLVKRMRPGDTVKPVTRSSTPSPVRTMRESEV